VGFAQLGGRQMSAGTTLMAYSMSKTITAAATLMLIERGRLGIDDPIAKYLSWQPYGDEVTVRQLLSHTAGIPNPIPLRWAHPMNMASDFDEHAALREVVRRHPRCSARPGARFAYSNIGYWLLGAVIEELTGEAFSAHVESQVFAPLGLSSRDLAYAIVDPATHAAGYVERWSPVGLVSPLVLDRALIGDRTGRWLAIQPHYVNGPAFGGIIGTARGFAVFLKDQLGNRSCLLGSRARSLMLEQQRVRHGPIPMTLGWHLGSVRGHEYCFKEGGGAGFHSMMRLYRARGVGSVLMTNATTFNVSKALDELDRRLLA